MEKKNDAGVGQSEEAAKISRRKFLKGGVAGAATLAGMSAVGGWAGSVMFPGLAPVALAKGVIVVNKAICSGCRVCEAVCSTWNSDGNASSALSRIILEKDYITGDYEPNSCLQCMEPPCLKACPISALQVDKQTGTNARIIDERACVGCRKCEEACALFFEPARPRFDAENHREVKCHLCFGQPQCVEFCPLGALRYEVSEVGIQTGYPIVEGV